MGEGSGCQLKIDMFTIMFTIENYNDITPSRENGFERYCTETRSVLYRFYHSRHTHNNPLRNTSPYMDTDMGYTLSKLMSSLISRTLTGSLFLSIGL